MADKAVEEMQEELKLLKNEIKETLGDVREYLLTNAENPFVQDSGAAAAAPPAPAAAPAPPAPAAAPAALAPQPQQQAPPPQAQPAQQAPPPMYPPQGGMPMGGMPMGGGGGGTPIIVNMGDGGSAPHLANAGAPMPARAPAPAPAPEASAASEALGLPSLGEMPSLASAPRSRPANTSRTKQAGANGASGQAPSNGQEARPASPRRPARLTEPDDNRATAPGRSSPARAYDDDELRDDEFDYEPAGGRTHDRTRDNETIADAPEFDEDDADLTDEVGTPTRRRRRAGGLGRPVRAVDEPRRSNRRQSEGTLDLITVAALAPWMEGGVRRIGKERLGSLLEVYAAMGGITNETRDILLQLLALDDTPSSKAKVPLRNSLRFLVELDDILWRGRQDWRRAALATMFADAGDMALDAEPDDDDVQEDEDEDQEEE